MKVMTKNHIQMRKEFLNFRRDDFTEIAIARVKRQTGLQSTSEAIRFILRQVATMEHNEFIKFLTPKP